MSDNLINGQRLFGDQPFPARRTERVSATDQVVERIKLAVRHGELSLGDRLPNESIMAEQLGVGRSTLREAIKILTAFGVVESRQGAGTYIVDKSAQNFFEFMGFFPSEENDVNYLELRRVLEVGNITTIYSKIDEDELQKLDKLVAIMNQPHRIDEYVDADLSFHRTLIAHMNNPMLIQLNDMLAYLRNELLNRIFYYPEIVEDAYIEHGRIVAALRSRNLEECVAAVNYHLDKTKDSVIKLFGNRDQTSNI